MTDLSRRGLLAACGVGASALAGCSTIADLGNGGESGTPFDHEGLAAAATDWADPDPPAAGPVEVPDESVARHRDRARELLDDVPADLSLPNEAVAREVARERERVASRVDERADGQSAERPLDRLDSWRRLRADAAEVRGTYLAAVDDVDAESVDERRRTVRSALAEFEADWTYRAGGPVAAVLVHATLEDLVESARDALRSYRPFPDRPTAAVSEVGTVFGDVERAAAGVADAAGLRSAYLDVTPDATSYRARLTGAARRLDRSLAATSTDVRQYLDEGRSALDADVGDAPAGELFATTAQVADSRSDAVSTAQQRYAHATAVLEAGRALAAVEALDAVVGAVRDGDYRGDATVSSVDAAHAAALDALREAWASSPESLAVELAQPATGTLRHVASETREGRGSGTRTAGRLRFVERYATVVPAATAFVVERLRE